jgi:hypothetical protein
VLRILRILLVGRGYGQASVPTSVPKPTRSLPQISIADDIIAIEHAARFVAAQFHRHAFGDAGADHVPNRRSTEVVRDAAWAAGGDPGAVPRVVEAAGAIACPDQNPTAPSLVGTSWKKTCWTIMPFRC